VKKQSDLFPIELLLEREIIKLSTLLNLSYQKDEEEPLRCALIRRLIRRGLARLYILLVQYAQKDATFSETIKHLEGSRCVYLG